MTSPPVADAAARDAERVAPADSRRLPVVRPVDALLLFVLFWGYDALCGLRPHAAADGMRHARWLESGVLSTVTAWEHSINAAVARSSLASGVCAHIYDDCHYAVTLVVILWLCAMRPALWPRLRRALWSIMAGALVVFYCWPVAPVRFLPGFVDVTARTDATVVDRADPTMYAAVPSLHVAWACWCAGAVIVTARSRWRWVAVGYPVVVAFVVVATANHALVDVVAGAALAGVATALCAVRPFSRSGWVGSRVWPGIHAAGG